MVLPCGETRSILATVHSLQPPPGRNVPEAHSAQPKKVRPEMVWPDGTSCHDRLDPDDATNAGRRHTDPLSCMIRQFTIIPSYNWTTSSVNDRFRLKSALKSK